MSQVSLSAGRAGAAGHALSATIAHATRRIVPAGAYVLGLVVAAVVLVLATETVLRGSFTEAAAFLTDPRRPGVATVVLVALALLGVDALMRRSMQGLLLVAPPLLALAWMGSEKRFYLGDPPYPTDFLYARQIVELLPLMAADRPLAAALMIVTAIAGVALIAALWRCSRRMPRISLAGRVVRLAVAVPALGYVATQMDYASHSPLRSSMKVQPQMWDQTSNYRHNGLVLAFALNVPMVNVAAPAGYSQEAIASVRLAGSSAYSSGTRRPDIVMVMSESFWDPTRLPGVAFSPDPLSFLRPIQSGNVFSPEFAGMTANVEFEALTGFSNAFLPYGSIPYQQYVRGEMPSLASFLKQEGYATLAVHPFQSWFWNRGNVYRAFGFDRFLSQENMPELEKRGRLASDAALTDLIISEVDAADEPMFLFAVTLQNHGPYEADRYPESRIEVSTGAGEPVRAAAATFAEGMMDSDQSLKRLVEWASTRKRDTVVVFFGDHLPPLGPTWVATGFMERTVSNRFGPAESLTRERETPLLVWSSRRGAVAGVGTVSPAFLPLHLLRAAGMEHPYYTGLLGAVHEGWRVVDRHLLITQDGRPVEGWSRRKPVDPLVRDWNLVQYDAMFGDGHAARRFFPAGPADPAADHSGSVSW